MRSQHLTFAVLASLLWCAAVFAFAGSQFVKYEAAANALRDAGTQIAMTRLRDRIQIEMDKGAALPEIEKVERMLIEFAADDADVLSAFVFNARTGRILYGTAAAQTGGVVPEKWVEKCAGSRLPFVDPDEGKEAVGLPLINDFSEREGCLVAEYKTASAGQIRENMISTTLRFSVRTAVVGVLAWILIFLSGDLKGRFAPNGVAARSAAVGAGVTLLIFCMKIGLSALSGSFETDLRPAIAAKAGIAAKNIRAQIEYAVKNGVPFQSINGLESVLNALREKNREIEFVLVTDKNGRVLYESGAAAKAFDADRRTGRISLRDGYYNAAESVNDADGAAGWVQIGVNERFARETAF